MIPTIPAQSRHRAFLLAGLCTAVLTACGGSTSSQAPRYPAGILVDANSANLIRGIYSVTSGDESCCWLDRDAAFHVPADADAKKLVLQVYVPPVGPLTKSPGTIALTSVSGDRAERPLHLGLQEIDFPISPRSISNGSLAVRLHMSGAFVPKEAGLNEDVRRLSVVLVSARTQ